MITVLTFVIPLLNLNLNSACIRACLYFKSSNQSALWIAFSLGAVKMQWIIYWLWVGVKIGFCDSIRSIERYFFPSMNNNCSITHHHGWRWQIWRHVSSDSTAGSGKRAITQKERQCLRRKFWTSNQDFASNGCSFKIFSWNTFVYSLLAVQLTLMLPEGKLASAKNGKRVDS